MLQRIIPLLALMLLFGGAQAQELYNEMPYHLRVIQETQEKETKEGALLRRTYPETKNAEVNAQMRELVDAMADDALAAIPKEERSEGTTIDAGAVITRTGTSWMSFLTLCETVQDKAQTAVRHAARVYDIETGEQISLEDVFPAESGAWALMEGEIRRQLSAAFPGETIDEAALDALCTKEALTQADFTLGAVRMTLSYRADAVYPGKHTLLHVHLYYPEIRAMMTPRAQAQTDNSRFPMAALTYDDGPARGHTRTVLDELRKYSAQATFFIIGDQMQKNLDILARQQDSAYSIQSHTYTHSYPGQLDRDEAFSEKVRLAQELAAITGMEPTMMRAPGGMEERYIEWGIGYPLMHWSLASGDSGSDKVDSIARKVIGAAGDGDVVLMHDLNPYARQYSARILKSLTDRGFLLVTLEELYAREGIVLEHETVYFSPSHIAGN